jgi:hypothetical protein
MAGTILAGGLALPSRGLAVCLVVTDVLSESAASTSGRTLDRSNNFGTTTNDGTHLGDVNDTWAGVVVTKSAPEEPGPEDLSNSGGAIINNSGTWKGDADNASVVMWLLALRAPAR